MKIFKHIATLAIALTTMGFASQVGATTLTIGDSRDLGLISKNQPADPTSSAGFIDILLDQPLGSGPTTIGANNYTRTTNDPLAGNYPAAVFGIEYGAVTSVDLGSGFLYLLAKYDGPNWGSEVWYVGGLTGTITIPQFGSGEQYGVSHVFLYNGNGGNGASVPEGGTSLALLGGSVAALFVVRRLLGS